MMLAHRHNELEKTRLEYWNGLVRLMRQRNSPINFNDPSHKHQLRAKADTFGSGKFILVALANVRPEMRIGVGVEISGTKEYYADLERNKTKIEGMIGYERSEGESFQWNPQTKVKDVWLYRPADFFERQQWPEQHEWFREKLEAFSRVLKPRIAELLCTRS